MKCRCHYICRSVRFATGKHYHRSRPTIFAYDGDTTCCITCPCDGVVTAPFARSSLRYRSLNVSVLSMASFMLSVDKCQAGPAACLASP